MEPFELILLTLVFFLSSAVGVVTGALSLINVPVMLQFGIEPRVAIATNMLALTFMSIGATLPFLKGDAIDRRRSPLLILLTVISSVAGALLVFAIPEAALPFIIGVAMLVIIAFVVLKRDAGVVTDTPPSRTSTFLGYTATLFLGVYGGFFSGGYMTLLTAAYVSAFRMTFLQAVATTKPINFFKSLVATAVFASQGVIDWPLGLLLSAAMFFGALVGARVTLMLSNLWIKRVFLAAVVGLAVKTLVFDVPWQNFL